eukprot:m.245901 g.245901  ORF g.245901 m.245901 type:complete len:88 (-) comp15371_c0_seq1:174-437(-)
MSLSSTAAFVPRPLVDRLAALDLTGDAAVDGDVADAAFRFDVARDFFSVVLVCEKASALLLLSLLLPRFGFAGDGAADACDGNTDAA